MRCLNLCLESIVRCLKIHINSVNNQIDYNVITFFDKEYPANLKKYSFTIPVIYYRGCVEYFSDFSAIIIESSPTFYVQKVLKKLSANYKLIGFESSKYSITNDLNMCDIIYTNNIKSKPKLKGKLIFSFPIESDIELERQLICHLIKNLFVLEGYYNIPTLKLVSQCLDNGVEIKSLPTNIFIKSGLLPNLLLAQGCGPLILNENKRG